MVHASRVSGSVNLPFRLLTSEVRPGGFSSRASVCAAGDTSAYQRSTVFGDDVVVVAQLFEGQHINYIECINVDFQSPRKESFYDIYPQLDVKGCRDVYASFDEYVEVERLEGDNRYHAETHGLQYPRHPAKSMLYVEVAIESRWLNMGQVE
ncbi:ubiquitin carboxyl-terminal hydrolase 12-like protein [Tanacetum coccineum]